MTSSIFGSEIVRANLTAALGLDFWVMAIVARA